MKETFKQFQRRLHCSHLEPDELEKLLYQANQDVSEFSESNSRLSAENKLLETSRDSFRDAYNKMRDGRRVEIRMPDGFLDEIVGYGGFHVEQMDKNYWFFDLGGCRFNVFGWDIRLQPVETDCWDNERERVSTEPAPDGINDRGSDEYANPDDTQQCGKCGEEFNGVFCPCSYEVQDDEPV